VQDVVAGGQQSVPQAVPVQDDPTGAVAQPVDALALNTSREVVNV
jgi:hypothetical protein